MLKWSHHPLLILLVSISLPSYAADQQRGCPPIASITEVAGIVKLQRQREIRTESVGQGGAEICAGDRVMTFADSSAVVRTHRGDSLVMDSNTTLRLTGHDEMEHLQGKGYYSIKKRGPFSGVKVATRLSVIGVRGTSFLISDAEDRIDVALAEGAIAVESQSRAFALYQQGISAEYNAYLQGLEQEFEQFKRQQQQEFIGYVRQIDMQPGQHISLSGNRAIKGVVELELQREIDRLKARL